MRTTWVVKLGGSLAEAAELPLWLEALIPARVVIVPGGGPFADQVRTAQQRWRFDDRTAHAMAVLAMAQYGRMLAGLAPGCAVASTVAGLATGVSAIWLPDPEALPEGEVPASWDVTADSLAAWLAGKLDARHLLLVKSAAVPEGPLHARQIAREGLVDPALPGFLADAGFKTWICGPEGHRRLDSGLRQPEGVFASVEPDSLKY